jgi:hypothetical protein
MSCSAYCWQEQDDLLEPGIDRLETACPRTETSCRRDTDIGSRRRASDQGVCRELADWSKAR